MDNPKELAQSRPDTSAHASRFGALKIPVSVAIGFLLGETIGKNVGAGYAGFDKISGSRIGEWIGFAVGISLAIMIVGLFTKSDASAEPRRVFTCVAVSLAFLTSAIVAVVAEAKLGELGGPIAFIAFWLVAGLAGYVFVHKGN